jgi:uncharacterized protein involved in exopolysaccharide biosynthesis
MSSADPHAEPPHTAPFLVGIFRLIGLHPIAIIGLPFVFAFGAGLWAMSRPRHYTATATFTPQATPQTGSQFAGLAAQFGVQLGSGEPNQSPDFYADILKSREILQATARAEYAFTHGDRQFSGTLGDLLGMQGDSALKLEATIADLRNRVVVSRGRLGTGLVGITVTMPWPALSQQVAQKLLAQLDEFNLKTRKTQAGAERAFTETQLAAARRSVSAVEDTLQRFLERNRQFRNSPELTFDYERLQRNLSMRQEIVTALSQSFERAKIDEVRSTPVLTIVDRPQLPARPDSRAPVMRVLSGGFIGAMIGWVIALLLETIKAASQTGTPMGIWTGWMRHLRTRNRVDG